MKIISSLESHKIALRLSCISKAKVRSGVSVAPNKLPSGRTDLKSLSNQLAVQLWDSGFEQELVFADTEEFPAYRTYAPMVAESRIELESESRYIVDPYLKLDPDLADQTVSLKNFSVSVQKYWIRLQNSNPDMTVDDFCAEMLIQRSYFYKLLRAERHPSRNLSIIICLALRLNIKEAQDLLMNLGEQLNRQVKRDYILIFGLENDLTIDQVEALLIEFNSKPLLSRF